MRHIQQLPGVQDRGAAQTVGPLEFGNCNTVTQAETGECIPGPDDISDPGVRGATCYLGMDGKRGETGQRRS